MTHYETLGIEENASLEAIKQAFRKKAKLFHPDVSKDKNGEEKFKQVTEAYEILSDATKRSAYDASLAIARISISIDTRGTSLFNAGVSTVPFSWRQWD